MHNATWFHIFMSLAIWFHILAMTYHIGRWYTTPQNRIACDTILFLTAARFSRHNCIFPFSPPPSPPPPPPPSPPPPWSIDQSANRLLIPLVASRWPRPQLAWHVFPISRGTSGPTEALCTVHCPLCAVRCALCTVHCTLCTVHCAVYSVKYIHLPHRSVVVRDPIDADVSISSSKLLVGTDNFWKGQMSLR